MAFDSTPWFVGGGAEHSPEVARTVAYAATRGAEGIIGIGDLKVQAQSTPNNTIRISPGAAVILNRYTGATQQSYIERNATQTNVTVTATGSSGGRTDLVVARVLDPQYEGGPVADPLTFQYARPFIVEGVPAGTVTAKDAGVTYPAIALAKITIPASTSTITSGMITDLRRVANPRRDRTMQVFYSTGIWKSGTANEMPRADYGTWPITLGQRPYVLTPDWATRLDIVCHMSGIIYARGSTSTDTSAGIRTRFGYTLPPSENSILVQDAADGGGRYAYTIIGTHAIDAATRGTVQPIDIQAVVAAGAGHWYADYQSSIVVDWEFSEGAV